MNLQGTGNSLHNEKIYYYHPLKLMALIPLITTLFVPVGNSMICSDIWHKYHKWYFEIVLHNLRQFWNITSGIYAKYHTQIMLLFVYTTTRKSFVIFTCRYFKLSWNTTAMSQSNCRNFSCSSITVFILLPEKFLQFDWPRAVVFSA